MKQVPSRGSRGLTITEAVIVLIVLAIIAALGLPLLHRSRCGAVSLKDKTQIAMIHRAIAFDSASRDGAYITPGLIQPLRPMDSDDPFDDTHHDYSLNHSAPLYSYMIMNQMVTQEVLVSDGGCGCEVNSGVSIKTDYDFVAYNPAMNRFWDSTFVMRIDDPMIGANCSFAHLAICGLRLQNKWRDSQSAGVACFGTRGTRNGTISGDDYNRSPTLRLHGPKLQWDGHVVFNDNHSETLNCFYSANSEYDSDNSGKSVKDNLYAAEFTSPRGNQAADDNFLGVFTGSTEISVNDVYDPLDP